MVDIVRHTERTDLIDGEILIDLELEDNMTYETLDMRDGRLHIVYWEMDEEEREELNDFIERDQYE